MNNLSVDFAWDRVRLFDLDACRALHDVCTECPRATVHEVKTKPKSKWRPLPLDTVELEKLASRKLKINAKETMRLAEKLYTQGYISYPRTETNEFPKEMNLGQLVGLQTGDPNWGAFAQGIIDSGGPTPRQGNKSDKAHPPIHPTKYTNSLSGNEQRLYEFIVRSFLACCSKDAQGQETTVAIDIANEKFSASGLMITERNYLDVYPYDKWSSKEIHIYQTGQTFDPTSIDMVDGSTSPPNLLTEADLIGLMEKHGIGTDATHAEHIETIKSRSYVALHEAHFVPGRLGMGLVEGYDAMGLALARPALRAGLEADLRGICEGTKDPRVVLAEQVAKYKEVYITVTAEATKIDNSLAERLNERPNEYTPTTDNVTGELQTVIKCPKCGSDMAVTTKKNNADEFYITCLSFPNCKNAVWFPSIVKSCQVLPETCSTCGPTFKKIKFEWRNNSISHLYPPPYTACLGGCDTTFLELLKIRLSSVRQVPENTRTQTNNTNLNTQNSSNRQNNTANRQNSDVNTNRQNSANRQNSSNSQHNANPRERNPVQLPIMSSRQGTQTRQFPPPSSSNRAENPTNQGLPLSGARDDNNVVCKCNNPAILLTVRKQTANFGKKFYKCAVNKENGGCDFFLWAPENEAQNVDTPPMSNSWGDGSNSSHNYGNNTSRGWGLTPPVSRESFQGNDDGVTCKCGLPSKKVTVHKEGPNKGRQFYGCSKDFNSRCNFFQWADEGSSTVTEWGSSGTSSSYRGRGRGRARTNHTEDGNTRTRRCGLCRQEGHTRARCPNNNSN